VVPNGLIDAELQGDEKITEYLVPITSGTMKWAMKDAIRGKDDNIATFPAEGRDSGWSYKLPPVEDLLVFRERTRGRKLIT
jgi:hypothetical protein